MAALRNIARLVLLKVLTDRCTWRIRRRVASGGSRIRIVGLGQPDLGRSEEHAYETNGMAGRFDDHPAYSLPIASQQPGGQRGGAPAPPAMTLTVPGFPDGGDIPVKFTQAAPGVATSEGLSPAISWAIPRLARSRSF